MMACETSHDRLTSCNGSKRKAEHDMDEAEKNKAKAEYNKAWEVM